MKIIQSVMYFAMVNFANFAQITTDNFDMFVYHENKVLCVSFLNNFGKGQIILMGLSIGIRVFSRSVSMRLKET